MKRFQITFKGQVYELDVEEIGVGIPEVAKTPSPLSITPSPTPSNTLMGDKIVLAPMPGKIVKVNMQAGDVIKRGDVVCILEAMKMENEIMATQDGRVSNVPITVGQGVSTGDVLLVIA